MLQSAGKNLQEARLARKLSIEQVAHATKIRPERVVDLENDDLSNFPDLTYAKGFLIIYAKFLSVDVSDFTGTLSNARRVGVDDYEYLQHAEARPGVTARPEPKSSPLGVLIIFAGIFIVLIGIFTVPRLFQIGSFDDVEKKRLAVEANAEPTISALPTATATPSSTPEAMPIPPTATPLPVSTPTPIFVAPTPEPTVEIRRAEPVRPIVTPQ